MENQKRERIESTIQKELGTIIERALDINPRTLVSITRVSFYPDNQRADVGVSVFPESETAPMVALLNQSAKSFIKPLQKRIRMGHIPDLTFTHDPGIAHNARVQALIEKNKETG